MTVTLPASNASANSLSIVDNRTGSSYHIPIENNSVRAVDFKIIKAPEDHENPAAQNEKGLRIFDPGFQNTACMTSQITYVDGEAGEISYRGHLVADLYRTKKFEDVAFLLIWGHLPSLQEAAQFQKSIRESPLPPSYVFDMIKTLPVNSHPTTATGAAFAVYASGQPEKIPAHCGKNLYKGVLELADKVIPEYLFAYSVIVAAVYCHLQGRPFTPPRDEYTYMENILLMMGYIDPATNCPDPRQVNLLNKIWILTADHELTNSTAAFLHSASTLADPYSCLVSAHMSGVGILHGGAIEVAFRQLDAIQDIDQVPGLIEAVKAGKRRLFGYGHRMYKVTDPRSILIRELIREAGDILKTDKSLAVAYEIDRIASQDEYFTSRNLCANPDLYISFVYKALGIPADFILPLSFLGRNPGFIAHWREVMADKQPRMWRPLQLYNGAVPPRATANGDL